MRVLDGEQILARVFFGESEKWHHQPLANALLERLRKEGFAGATLMRAVAGFGGASVIRTAHLVDLSANLPMVLEIVDDQQHVDRLLEILDETMPDGLVTIEKVRVLRYAPRPGAGRPRD